MLKRLKIIDMMNDTALDVTCFLDSTVKVQSAHDVILYIYILQVLYSN